jgi:hypothetical protein
VSRTSFKEGSISVCFNASWRLSIGGQISFFG